MKKATSGSFIPITKNTYVEVYKITCLKDVHGHKNENYLHTHDRESLTTCYNYGYKRKQLSVYFNQSASDQVSFKLYKVIVFCSVIKKNILIHRSACIRNKDNLAL